ncbi:hypothetical protein D9758_012671 [Tetrapyrgos nigripes]|uniref:Uncharacterized protein n=1 Tax=Tetrapyrgos nigripes TaxID=182062 RepID=A0A8H5GDP5_9AGAR|nr:hypothetical protein D9758_012671 [Tetrapyrgos nigripes]
MASWREVYKPDRGIGYGTEVPKLPDVWHASPGSKLAFPADAKQRHITTQSADKSQTQNYGLRSVFGVTVRWSPTDIAQGIDSRSGDIWSNAAPIVTSPRSPSTNPPKSKKSKILWGFAESGLLTFGGNLDVDWLGLVSSSWVVGSLGGTQGSCGKSWGLNMARDV